MSIRALLLSGLFALTSVLAEPAPAGVPVVPGEPQDRVRGPVTGEPTFELRGNVHPAAASSPSTALRQPVSMDHMILYLKADAAQEAQLQQLIAAQQDPKSSFYHHFITPQEYAAHFGASQNDIGKVAHWLTANGFTIDELPEGHRSIVFSGDSNSVNSAFRTEIRKYAAGGSATHFANATNPQVPTELADVVGGIVKLHNFRHQRSISRLSALPQSAAGAPQYSGGQSHYLSPADYATIYDINPVYSAGTNGRGQSIAVIARSNISTADVTSFRQAFGLPTNDPSLVIVNQDPGVLQGDSTETTLDTEWSGAVAPGAAIKVVIAASTYADGIDLSAQYAVNKNVAPVISLSYGSCEAAMGASEMSFYNALWQQAAAQGQTVLVSAGDSGAAGCNGGSDATGYVRAVNGLCSSPYSTCVGGTQFNEGNNPGQYWQPGNNPVYGSATSYIPEAVWNESGLGAGLWAGGGGVSSVFPKPAWQTGPGVPADGQRDVPDVALTAAGHDGYIIVENGSMYVVSGTSAAAPSFAGLMALVDQKQNAPQGNANAILYPLAVKQAAGGAGIFHDTMVGNNSVPGVSGFTAARGYDAATGLGSVDAFQMVNHWTDASQPVARTLKLTASSTSIALNVGQSQQATITSIASSSLQSAVILSASGLPTGFTATLGSHTIALPGSGSAVLTVTAASSAHAGTYALTVTAQGGGQTATLAIAVTVTAPTFTLSGNAAAISSYAGNSSTITLAVAPKYGFNSTVVLSAPVMPAGVTGSFSPATISGANGGSSVLTMSVSTAAKPGSYPFTLKAVGGGVTEAVNATLTIALRPTCSLAAIPSAVRLTAGQSLGVQVTCGSVSGSFPGPISLSVSNQPAGVTTNVASLLPAGASTMLAVASVPTAKAGSYILSVNAVAPGFAQTLSLPLTLLAPSTFTLAAAQSAVTANRGASVTDTITAAHLGTFNAAIALAVTGLPNGVTAQVSRASVPAPGDGTALVTFNIASSVTPGVYALTIVGTGGGVKQSTTVSLTVAAPAGFSLTVSNPTVTLTAGGAAGDVTFATTRTTYTGTITITFTNLAPGMNWGVVSATMANGTLTEVVGFTAASYTPAGTYKMLVNASGGAQSISVPVTVTVVQP